MRPSWRGEASSARPTHLYREGRICSLVLQHASEVDQDGGAGALVVEVAVPAMLVAQQAAGGGRRRHLTGGAKRRGQLLGGVRL